jgi:hypothetical protein
MSKSEKILSLHDLISHRDFEKALRKNLEESKKDKPKAQEVK